MNLSTNCFSTTRGTNPAKMHKFFLGRKTEQKVIQYLK